MSNPQPQGPKSAPVLSPPKSATLVKARVRPNNRYGAARAGEIVEVEPSEIKRVPHALITLDEEARLEEEAKKPAGPKPENQIFRAHKAAALRSMEARREARKELLRKQIADVVEVSKSRP